jgi:hypothetical protein
MPKMLSSSKSFRIESAQTMSDQRLHVGIQQDEQLPSDQGWAVACLPKFIARFCVALLNRVPLGYEDENGFHQGSKFNAH